MEVFFCDRYLRPCVVFNVLLGLTMALPAHEAHQKRRERTRNVAGDASAAGPIRGHVNGRGIYVTDRHLGLAQEDASAGVLLRKPAPLEASSEMNKDTASKTRQAPFMRREQQFADSEEDLPVVDEWPEMEASSFIEADASSTAASDEAFNWWDRRRRRRRVNCRWTSWSGWKGCTRNCGAGQKQRDRRTVGPFDGGRQCEGPKQEFSTCNTQNCAVDCEWNHWGAWGPCSKTCGHGTKTRYRGSLPFTDRDGGTSCPASGKTQTHECSTFNCPIPCVYEEWGLFGGCSKTCGTGYKRRTRLAINGGPLHGGAPCPGKPFEDVKCNAFMCPKDCKWSSWGGWGVCSKTCGAGLKMRMRSYAPMMMNGGVACPGSPAELLACDVQECPRDCTWAEWNPPSPCTKTCGGGVFKRHRSKVHEVAFGGKTCEGQPDTEIGPCNVEPCAVDCQYHEWSVWGECSASCGGGIHQATRNGTNPKHGGKLCDEANATKEESCNTQECPVLVDKSGAHRRASVQNMVLLVAVVAPMIFLGADA